MSGEYLRQTFSLEGRNILVVGGRGGIGSGIVGALVSAGAEVWLSSRRRELADEAAQAAAAAGAKAHGLAMDMCSAASISAAAGEYERETQGRGLDGLVLNAGGILAQAALPPGKCFAEVSPEYARKTVDLNYFGPREVVRVFEPLLMRGRTPVITAISSVAPLGLSRVLDYAAAKAGLDELIRFLALHLVIGRENPIRTNAVRVGFLFSDDAEAQNAYAQRDPARYQAILNHIPFGRSAAPAEIGNAVLFLQSRAASYVNGGIIDVDGGFLCNRLGVL